ncbi:MAG: hypothetical protein H6905_09050 [Hyphomicrobiales bacterium]|nr:hypothetical protein [Hyphomicrobiales bacterium]
MSSKPVPDFADLKRQLDHATDALKASGMGNPANLECRVSDLRDRLLSVPARSLNDLEVRLAVMRDLIAGLGPPGYLAHLVNATLDDVKEMQKLAMQNQDAGR